MHRHKKTAILKSFRRNLLRLVKKLPRPLRLAALKIIIFSRQHRLLVRAGALFMVAVLLFAMGFEFFSTKNQLDKYDLSKVEHSLLKKPNDLYDLLLKVDSTSGTLNYNAGYMPGGEVSGDSSSPKITASFTSAPDYETTVTDPVNEVSITLKPKFRLGVPQKNRNRVVYPIANMQGAKVYTLKGSGVKEDIILYENTRDELKFEYELKLPDGLEARTEVNGSLGVYGVQSALLGNVSAGSEQDAELLKKARENGEKNQVIFSIPAPIVVEAGRKKSSAQARFELNGSTLSLYATGLKNASYPLSIDPSIYVDTAARLMRGNNETNTDFDIDDELIQKSQTTGARIDEWTSTSGLNAPLWDHATTAAGGYLYNVGGLESSVSDDTVAYVRSAGSTGTSTTLDIDSAGTNRLVVVMAGDESTGTNLTGATVDGKACTLVTRADNNDGLGNHAEMWYCDEDNLGASNESVTVAITGGDASWAVHAHLYTGVSQSGPTDSGIDNTSVGGTTVTVNNIDVPDDGVAVMVANNGNAGSWSDGGWTSPLTERTDSNYPTSAVMATASGIESSPQTNKTYVATASAAHNRASAVVGSWDHGVVAGAASTSAEVNWAQFNSSSLAVDSPNPGNGVCSGWCTDSAYNLPEARRGFSLTSYNGFLYAIGGVDGSGNRESTVFIAKLGANGEPQLWHPTDPDKPDWVYWYTDSGLSSATARSYLSAVPYNNRMYILGGQTNASGGGTTTMEFADIRPNGTLGTWTSGTALPAARHSHTAHIYNDTLYLIGGNNAGTLQSAVSYAKINSDGTMNSWVTTASFTTARSTWGGAFSTIWGAYIYISGGCSAVNGSGYCTTIASDTQIGSINADGSISEWGTISGLSNQRIGYGLLSWQNGLYRLGGCSAQNTTTGACNLPLSAVDYGVINSAGEVSTVSVSAASGVSPCSGGSPVNCDLPPPGDDAGEGGQLLSMTAIMNGYLYNIGGCIDYDCNGTTPAGDDTDVSGNVSYVAVSPSGQLTAPGSCGGTSYGAWCVDNTNKINNTGSGTTDGIAAGGVATFGGRIYIVGGLTGNGLSTNIYYNDFNSDGSLNGAWESVDTTAAGITEDIAYTFAYARANPSSAGTYPGNLFVFGGCGNNAGGAGCGGADYETEVYKCNITTTGAVETADANDCTTSGQLQIDSTPGVGGTDGLGIHSGTVYANYVFLVGGFSQAENDKDDVLYAEINNSNNIVAVSGSDWVESPNKLSVGRRRGWAFGYNGHIYAVGGYDDSGTGIIPFIEWSKMNVSDGSIEEFITSSVTINQRWGLSMVVSNSYAYVIGGCDAGASPSGCTSFEASVQTFQLYNNDSGAVSDFTAQSDDTFTTAEDRWGASSTVYNGYLYVAGGCVSATDCTDATNSVQYAPISATDGSIGTWAAGGNLPADRAWGSLEVAGGTLYYVGGQDDTATNEQTTVYYTSSISSGNPTWNGSAATNGLPGARTKFGTAVWNNRLYVVGGLDGSAAVSATVYVSPQQNSGGNITSAWASSTAFNVARTGAAVTAYANNLYLFGGFDGTNYLSDAQFTQINSDGTVDSWTYTTSLPGPLRDGRALAANGYMYVIGGRSAATTCAPNTLITPVSANTTIATGNNPTGIGEWYETNVRYASDRYGPAVAYENGKIYTMGGGCTAPIDCSTASICNYQSTIKSQPQVAKYSRLIDTDTDVFPNSWLMNGVDNSIGARWQVRYRSSTNSAAAWGQETNYGSVTLGDVAPYVPRDSGGTDTEFARYYYFNVSIDASKTFGYPEDVARGPTITDLSLFFTADPSKRLRHGKTFTGGQLQPLDTPCRQSNDADCPLP